MPPSISKLAIEKAPESAPTYVFTLDIAHFLFVPPAPSSTIIKSASAKLAFISVPPFIFISLNPIVPILAANVIVSLEAFVVIVILLPAASVNVSVVESATTSDCPDTDIVLNKF